MTDEERAGFAEVSRFCIWSTGKQVNTPGSGRSRFLLVPAQSGPFSPRVYLPPISVTRSGVRESPRKPSGTNNCRYAARGQTLPQKRGRARRRDREELACGTWPGVHGGGNNTVALLRGRPQSCGRMQGDVSALYVYRAAMEKEEAEPQAFPRLLSPPLPPPGPCGSERPSTRHASSSSLTAFLIFPGFPPSLGR